MKERTYDRVYIVPEADVSLYTRQVGEVWMEPILHHNGFYMISADMADHPALPQEIKEKLMLCVMINAPFTLLTETDDSEPPEDRKMVEIK